MGVTTWLKALAAVLLMGAIGASANGQPPAGDIDGAPSNGVEDDAGTFEVQQLSEDTTEPFLEDEPFDSGIFTVFDTTLQTIITTNVPQ